MTQTAKFLFLTIVVLAAGTLAPGQTSSNPGAGTESTGVATKTMNGAGIRDSDNPVAQVRNAKSWELGPFVNWGTGVGDRSDFKFFSAGFQLGKPLSPVLHAGILTGQFELGGNIMPLWQAYTPAPHQQLYDCNGQPCELPIGGGTFTGASLTPVIFRWNFLTHSRRFQPWFQGAGGLIYTSHKFPPDVLVPHGTPGGTSVWNFSPQGGIGLHYFTRSKRSIDLGVNAVHISSASLGDRNPGVNASIQVQVGYTFWK
ncbi:MAG: acyloxyacyl hydrolase [Terracidiphilus sp.]